MAQEYITFNGTKIKQPDSGSLTNDWSTTYTDDSDRSIVGNAYVTPLFTYEAFGYEASNLTKEEMKEILQIVGKGFPFTMHYMSSYYGEWRDDEFYVGKGSMTIGSWKQEEETWDNLSFNIICINPID